MKSMHRFKTCGAVLRYREECCQITHIVELLEPDHILFAHAAVTTRRSTGVDLTLDAGELLQLVGGQADMEPRYGNQRRHDVRQARGHLPVMSVDDGVASRLQHLQPKHILEAVERAQRKASGHQRVKILTYVIDGSAAGCISICGVANCSVTTIVSNARGYRSSDFLGAGVTPNSFYCRASGFCEFAR